jgi:NAD(P)-dependent dehydrogenase (short-subunit alcohol dehydrogenase family)
MNEQSLTSRTAVVYGAGGMIGAGVARAFAREGATVHLAGRTRAPLDALAQEIGAAGGTAHVAVLDATDEAQVDAHARSVGRIDVSLNLITRGDVQGIPLADMSVADVLAPTLTGLTSEFLTARAAARSMKEHGGGVILWLKSGSAATGKPDGYDMGGTPAADAAAEALLRHLAGELGPHGIRVAGIYTAGVRETLSPEHVAAVEQIIVPRSALGRLPTLAEVAETAVFLASDRASGITGSHVNVTAGLLPE